MTDIQVENHGTIVLLRPLTEAGRAWVNEHIVDQPGRDLDAPQTWGDAIVCEPRYVGPILEGAQADGLEVA